jgi:hypothetical protein
VNFHLLRAACSPVVEPGIEQLRNMPDRTEQPPVTHEQFCRIAEMIVDASYSREAIETELNITTEALLQAIVELARFMLATRGNPSVTVLGTWSEVVADGPLALPGLVNAAPAPASKRKAEAVIEAAKRAVSTEAADQPVLFADLLTPAKPARKGKAKAVVADSKKTAPVRVNIVLPDGFSKTAVGKDIEGSLIAIVALHPSSEDVTRFIQRHYRRSAQPLSFEMLAAVWTFARLKRTSGLAKVSEAMSFVRNCVAAWDTLEVARLDAMNALSVLATSSDEAVLRDAVVKLQPVWEAEARNLKNLLEAGSTDTPAFQRAQLWLAKRVAAGQLVVMHVSDLNEGQVRRIAMLAGLDTEVISRNEETYIRTKLAELNLSLDAEQLVPVGVTAVRKGLEEAFFEACQKRADGDQEWASDLEALLLAS